MTLLQLMTVAALLVTGMGVALLGSVKLPLARRLEIDEARVGALVSVFGFIMIPVVPSAGFVTDLVGKQAVLVAGSVLIAAGLALLGRSRSYAVAFAAVVLLGAGWSAAVNVVNVIVPTAFGGSKAYATNLANVFFGMGAFLTPLGVSALLRRVPLAQALTVLGGLALVPGLLVFGVDSCAFAAAPNPAAPSAAAGPGIRTLLADPMLWLCAFALFFYAPLEATTAAWATTYLGEKGQREALAANILAGFWLMFMAARLVTAFSLPEGGETTLILALALACVAVLTGVVFNQDPAVSAILVLTAGGVFGPIFPTIMAILLGHFDAAIHGRAVGMLFAIGGIGWTVIPILIGTYARRTSVQRGFLIAAGSAIGLCLIALMLTRLGG
jgi:fucose permease